MFWIQLKHQVIIFKCKINITFYSFNDFYTATKLRVIIESVLCYIDLQWSVSTYLKDSLTRLSLCEEAGPGLAEGAIPGTRVWKAFSVLGILPDMFTCFANAGLPAPGLVTATLGTTFGIAWVWREKSKENGNRKMETNLDENKQICYTLNKWSNFIPWL